MLYFPAGEDKRGWGEASGYRDQLLKSAVQYAGVGLIEEWIQCYLLFSNQEGSECQDMLEGEPLFFGVVKLPLRLIQPIEGGIADHSDECDKDTLSQQPPLLVQYEAGKFYCAVQQELFALLKRCKVNAYPSIITLKGSADFRRYNNHFGNVFFYVKE